jgi:hypothetical protein
MIWGRFDDCDSFHHSRLLSFRHRLLFLADCVLAIVNWSVVLVVKVEFDVSGSKISYYHGVD